MNLKILTVVVLLFISGISGQNQEGEDEQQQSEDNLKSLISRVEKGLGEDGMDVESKVSDSENEFSESERELKKEAEKDEFSESERELKKEAEKDEFSESERELTNAAESDGEEGEGGDDENGVDLKERQLSSMKAISFRPRFQFTKWWGQCCDRRTMTISLWRKRYINGYVPDVYVYGGPSSNKDPKVVCSIPALLRVRFQRLRYRCYGCVMEPECGRRMLQVDLRLASQKKGWVFNVGDSRRNDGNQGIDGGYQQNDAELVGKDNDATVYGNDFNNFCKNAKKVFANAIGPGVNYVRLFISNEHIRIQNNKGLNTRICSRCLFALNNQADNQGTKNQYVYIGLNRVVRWITKSGVGVCSATVRWACPCCD